MPELPEVEVVRRGIATWAAGRQVRDVVVHDHRSLRRYAEGATHFIQQLTGMTLATPQRRGKFLWIPLHHQGSQPGQPAGENSQAAEDQPSQALVIHLGMSGQVLMQPACAELEKHLKVTVQLAEQQPGPASDQPQTTGLSAPDQLRFVDQRIFGGMQLSELVPAGGLPTRTPSPQQPRLHSSGQVPAVATHIAPDPLEPVVTAESFFTALRRRRTGLKRALLDQSMISGVGNIYADEALWLAKLHYARRTETITRAQASRLLAATEQVMAAALEAGGTSFDALYVNVNGESGYFERSLQVYGQDGRECTACAASIRRDKFMGRSSYWCPRCQPRPRNGRW